MGDRWSSEIFPEDTYFDTLPEESILEGNSQPVTHRLMRSQKRGQLNQARRQRVARLFEESQRKMNYPFDQPGVYAIHVAGEVDERWSDRLGGLTIVRTESAGKDHRPVSVLLGLLLDQAALAGVLDTLYQNGYPLLYVKYLGST